MDLRFLVRSIFFPRSATILFLGTSICFGLCYAQEKEQGAAKAPAPAELIIVERDQDIAKDLIAFSKGVWVRGVVRRGVAALGGTVIVEGTVRGDVAVVGGSIEIRDGAIINGDVIVIGGNIRRDPLGRIDGKVFATSFYQQRLIEFFQNPSRLFFHVDYSPEAMIWRGLRMACWFLLTFIVFKLFPQQILRASRNLELQFGKAAFAGLVGSIALATSLIVFLALCVILVGVPLVIGWGVVSLGVWIFGSTAVYYVLGSIVARTFLARRLSPSPALLLFSGLLMLGLIRLLPVFNFLAPYVVFALGLGTIIRTFPLDGRFFAWKKIAPADQ
jgi:hypothetical protein